MQHIIKVLHFLVFFRLDFNKKCKMMQTRLEKEEHISMIKSGHLDIIVGTHALLGNRVVYSNLGLLIVDEEQVLAYLCLTFLYIFSFILSVD